MDGSIHDLEEVQEQDQQRQTHLEAHELFVMRFSNEAVKQKPEEIIQRIEAFLQGKRRTEIGNV